MRHVIVGTAGHIDHGKSSLVQALTGTDPDRLREEKARGITIELGFAHTTEGDVVLSFVDVPGHERFVRNMLAGVGGMDLVMLHVAADESVMPQTREHFEICRLLQVPTGLVVITKSDLADTATLDVVRLEVQELVAGSFLEGAPVLSVSARTGHGLPELRRALAAMGTTSRPRMVDGPPRLPVDRVFSMKGFGTVVTGTLLSGRLAVDQPLVLQPSGREVKVRGLQVHAEAQGQALAGQRVAVNLAGIEIAHVARGEILTAPDAVSVTRRADVAFELLASARPLAHGARVRFHQGTRELLGRVVLPKASQVEPGTVGSARIHLEARAALVRGDRFILRAYSPLETIAGGVVLDPLPPRRGVRTATGVARFTRLDPGAPDAAFRAVATMVEEAGLAGLPIPQLGSRAGVLAPAAQTQVVERLERENVALRIGSLVVAASAIATVERAVLAALATYHAGHPLEDGMPREELRERFFTAAPTSVFEEVLRGLASREKLVARDRVALAGHSVALTDEERRVRDAVVVALEEAALLPPDVKAFVDRLRVRGEVVDRMVALLIRQGVLVRLGDLVFHESAVSRLKADVKGLKASNPTLDVGAFKDRYGMSRKHAIPLLEYLDRERVTKRVGERRRIL